MSGSGLGSAPGSGAASICTCIRPISWLASTYVAHPLLVAGEPGRRVPVGGGELPSQHVGADQGEPGARPGHRRRAERRISEQPHPPDVPAVHHHLGDLVEVEVGGVVEVREDALGLPAEAGHLLAQQPLLRFDVAVVDVEVGCGEGQHGDREVGVGDGPQAGGAPGLLVVEQPAVQSELVGHGVEGEHEPEVTDELLARPEDHRPQR